jgi:hypothetical protein
VLKHALAPLKKTVFPVVSSFLSVLGHIYTGFLAKAREKPARPRFEKAWLAAGFLCQGGKMVGLCIDFVCFQSSM